MIQPVNNFKLYTNTAYPVFTAKSNPEINDALEISEKLYKNGFTLSENQLFDYLRSEIVELENATANNDFENMTEELGDIVFNTVQLASVYGINPLEALASTNKKINDRFEKAQKLSPKPLIQCSYREHRELWEKAKNQQKESVNYIV